MQKDRKKYLPHAGEQHGASNEGSNLRDFILGGQDGLVNVMGIVLGVAIATNDSHLVIIAGVVATFAESISMAAVAYTSTLAEKSYFDSLVEKEKWEMKNIPKKEVSEVRDIYYDFGFRGKQLDDIVKKITSNDEIWLKVMLQQELGMPTEMKANPIRAGVIVGISAFIGSLIPLIPFFLGFPVAMSMWIALLLGVVILFFAGAYKAKVTVGSWWKAGMEMAIIGTVAAIAGYLIGMWLGAPPG
jgi:vacuolar iron transporter family protein